MNAMEEIVGWIRRELNQTPHDRVEELNHPSGVEVGLKHPQNRGQVLLRDDDAVELTNGPAVSVIADGGHGVVTMRAPAVVLEGQYVHVHAPDHYWGYQRWDPLHWWRALIPGDMVSWLWNGPLVANNQGALGALLSLPLVAGVPHKPVPDDTPVQYNVRLGSFIHAQPLLGPDESLLLTARHLAELLATLTPGG